MTKLKYIIPIVLGFLCVLCLGAAIGFFFWEHPEEVEIEEYVEPTQKEIEKQEYAEELFDEIVNQDRTPTLEKYASEFDDVSAGSSDVSENAAEEEIVLLPNPYKEKFLENSDMIAWIKIPDTQIDHPVMYTPDDEEYYLRRDFYKKKSTYGTPLMDTDSSMYPSSTNIIIHGHNFTNDTFYFLYDYKEKDFCDSHPYIHLYGKDCDHIYQVMAVFRSKVYYTTDTCFKYYKFFNAETEEEFNDFYTNVKDLALYDTGVTASFGDHFITLSTCSAHTDNGRFVVVGKEIEPGDSYLPIEDEDVETEDENN